MHAQIMLGIALILLAGGMLAKGRSPLIAPDHPDISEADHVHERKRLKLGRVMVLLIGLIGIAMVSGVAIHNSRRLVLLWAGVLSLVLAIFVTALLDMINTHKQLRRIRRQQQIAQQRWQQEMVAELKERRPSHSHENR